MTSVGLNNWGEPLLHPNIIDMIAYANKKGLNTIFATNATLLTKKLSYEIIKAGLTSIQFSIDGIGETYKKIRNTDIEPIMQNISDFIDVNKKYGNTVNTCIVCTVGEYNEKECSQLLGMWSRRVDNVFFQPRLKFQKSGRESLCPELQKSHLVVLSDGRVVPCCADFNGSLIVGRVPEQSLNEIYNGLAMKKLREKHKKGVFEGACLYCCEYKTPLNIKKRFE